MTLVNNQLFEQKSLYDESTQEIEDEPSATKDGANEGSSMFLWDWVVGTNTQTIGELYQRENQAT